MIRKVTATGGKLEYALNRDGVREGRWKEYHPPPHSRAIKHDATFKGDLLEGRWREWAPDGTLLAEGDYHEGLAHGRWSRWYPDGERWSQGEFRKGYRHGRTTYWNTDTSLFMVADYDRGKLAKVLSLPDPFGRETVLPDGEILVWKACRRKTEWYDFWSATNVYVRIRVPADARRVTPYDPEDLYKSRIEYGVVVGIEDAKGNAYTEADSFIYEDAGLHYVVGCEVHPDGYNPDPELGCGQGIHVYRYKDHCTPWFHASL